MKVLLYQGGRDLVKTSGIGKAMEHQEKALQLVSRSYTKDPGEPFDLVQLNTVFPDSFFMAKKAKRQGKKVVYYAHSTMEDFKHSFTGSTALAPLFKKWLKICYGQGDLVITPTPYSRKLLEGLTLEKPIVSLSNGIDLNFFDSSKGNNERFRQFHNLKAEAKVIVSIGHYIERKGILDFVELARRLPEYEFVWLGYTSLKVVPKGIGKAVRTNLPNLQFPGYVSQEELRDALAAADLFFFPTFEETEGIVLLEAMAMKVPALVRDIPIYQTLKANEEVYKATNLTGFEQMIRKILENKVADLTEKGYDSVQHKSLPTIGRKLSRFYDEIMEPEEQFK